MVDWRDRPQAPFEDRRNLESRDRYLKPFEPGRDNTFVYADRSDAKLLPYIDPVADWWQDNPEELDRVLTELGYSGAPNEDGSRQPMIGQSMDPRLQQLIQMMMQQQGTGGAGAMPGAGGMPPGGPPQQQPGVGSGPQNTQMLLQSLQRMIQPR